MIRSAPAMPTLEGMDEAPARAGRSNWIQLPIVEAERLSLSSALRRYCEAWRCRGKRRTATTFHAVIGLDGDADYAWVACADCTGLMIEGAFAT
jgi:hypothetical protein